MLHPSQLPQVHHNAIFLMKEALRKHKDAVAFRPYLGEHRWGTVTFHELEQHIAASSLLWKSRLRAANIYPRDVVGCLLTGTKYEDLINVIGLCAAGYIPQLFVPELPDAVVCDLMVKSAIKALVYDPHYASRVLNYSVVGLVAPDLDKICATPLFGTLLGDIPPVDPKETVFIVHSSGTSSGIPKIIPESHIWLRTFALHKWRIAELREYKTQTAINTIATFVRIGAIASFVGAIVAGSCTIQSPARSISVNDLLDMINICGLNTAMAFAEYVSPWIRAAQEDTTVLRALQGLRLVMHAGVPLNAEDEEWGHAHFIPLLNFYSTTETGYLLASTKGASSYNRLLRSVAGSSGQFIPHVDDTTQQQLCEIVVPCDAPDAPHSSFIGIDGLYHTGDLFERVEDDGYVYRGRTGDWVSYGMALVDTKSIEDAIRRECHDLISDCVLGGTERELPAILVESRTTAALDDTEATTLKHQIVERMKSFNRVRLPWETVDEPRRILVVPKGSLVRTQGKGNISRKQTEHKFSREIADMYQY